MNDALGCSFPVKCWFVYAISANIFGKADRGGLARQCKQTDISQESYSPGDAPWVTFLFLRLINALLVFLTITIAVRCYRVSYFTGYLTSAPLTLSLPLFARTPDAYKNGPITRVNRPTTDAASGREEVWEREQERRGEESLQSGSQRWMTCLQCLPVFLPSVRSLEWVLSTVEVGGDGCCWTKEGKGALPKTD